MLENIFCSEFLAYIHKKNRSRDYQKQVEFKAAQFNEDKNIIRKKKYVVAAKTQGGMVLPRPPLCSRPATFPLKCLQTIFMCRPTLHLT